MIADLKADSARWEAELMRRSDAGYPRGSYNHHHQYSQGPNMVPASYQASAIHEVRQEIGPSQTPPFSSAPGQSYSQSYMDPMYAQASYGTQSPPYQPPPSYPQGHSPFVQGQNPYPQAQMPPYSGQTQPPVTAEMHPAYTYAANAGYTYDPGRNNPRYQPGYDPEQDYTHSPVTSGMAYPATSAPDPRIPMDPRYTPESTYPDRNNRPQPTRGARR